MMQAWIREKSQLISAMRAPMWVLVHVFLYGLLVLVDGIIGCATSTPVWSLEAIFVVAIFTFTYLALMAVVPMTVLLVVLWAAKPLSSVWFRVVAVALCSIPLLWNRDAGQLVYFAPLQLLMAFLIRQPASPRRLPTSLIPVHDIEKLRNV